jgi:small subunit ribosomal protein S6
LPNYESVFIARQDISAAQVDGLTEAFEKVITDAGGSVAKRENWGLRTMAYKIKKNRKGHYVLLNFDAPAPALHEMERQMRINEDVLRYMTLRIDEFEEGPSAMMRNKDRDDRPRRGGDRDRAPRRDAPSDAPAAEEKPKAADDAESKGDEA